MTSPSYPVQRLRSGGIGEHRYISNRVLSYHTLSHSYIHSSPLILLSASDSQAPCLAPSSASQVGGNTPFPSLIPSCIFLFIRNYKPPRILLIPHPRPCPPRTSLSSKMCRYSFSPSSLPCPFFSVMRAALSWRSPEWILVKAFIRRIGPFGLWVIITLIIWIWRWWRGTGIWRSRPLF